MEKSIKKENLLGLLMIRSSKINGTFNEVLFDVLDYTREKLEKYGDNRMTLEDIEDLENYLIDNPWFSCDCNYIPYYDRNQKSVESVVDVPEIWRQMLASDSHCIFDAVKCAVLSAYESMVHTIMDELRGLYV